MKHALLVLAVLACVAVIPATLVKAETVTVTFYLADPVEPAGFPPPKLLANQDPAGLSARAIFAFDTTSPLIFTIDLANTSTGAPASFSNSDIILTAISFDMGEPRYNSDPQITGDSRVVIGPGLNDRSVNFDSTPSHVQLGPLADVSGEWGYGNFDGTGLLSNILSASRSSTTGLPGSNLDGPDNIDGPQAGVVADAAWVNLGGLGAVTDSVFITVVLDKPIPNLDFLFENGVRSEFGSDAAFLEGYGVQVPEPATMGLLALGGMALLKRQRKS